ncbi:M1 family metallopeptidase [Planococcus maritimus]|uniref:M1 family metallopeptidase n=1 Tax=Planococcus maritimus TaxID=192421 RepID=UPI001ABFA245|nr:M1 family metallopeptidase [Planococcus maritimus]
MNNGILSKSANYAIDLKMTEAGTFRISADVMVNNDSQESWSDIAFFFVVNEMNSESNVAEVNSVSSAGDQMDYELNNGVLFIELESDLLPGKQQTVLVEYSLTIPEDGLRLTRSDNNVYLAHWYPMLAEYDAGWRVNDYDPKGESYETGYGDYAITYRLPDEYLIATSAPDGPAQASSSGTLTGAAIKDFYAAFLNPADWQVAERKSGETELRVFVPAESAILEETAELSVEAFAFFEQNIGDYPFAELDLIANDGYMEYPNIVEVPMDKALLDSILVHEIAHQWFYYLVSNDPYENAWLDESLTEFSTGLFLSDYYGDEDGGFQTAQAYKASTTPKPYADLALDEFDTAAYYATIYGEVPLLLKGFFDQQGGNEAALEFLAAYYEEFQFRRVTKQQFRDFFEGYFEGDQQEFLNSWLQS